MAIEFTDPSKLPLQESPWAHVFENVLKGYKMAEEPRTMRREAEAKELANSLTKATIKLREAQTSKANRPAGVGGLKGALAQAYALRNSLPPGSKDFNQVQSYIDNYGKKNGIQVVTNPDGTSEISIGGNSEPAQVMGLPALPKGQTYLFNEEKKPIGIGKPYTEAEKKEYGGREAFNIYQPFITAAQAPYSGQGATAQFESDIANYTKDEAAKSRIDNLLAADSLLFSTTVKEEATLGGANTNQAYNRITHSLETSEIYPLLKKIAQYQLPRGYAKASKDIFNKKLNEGAAAGQRIPAFKSYYFDPNYGKGGTQSHVGKTYNLATRSWE